MTSPMRTAIHELHRQFILGDESVYAPYVNYLMNQPRGRIPSEWTDAGKLLLSAILDRRDDDDEGLPPQHFLKGFEETWIGECRGEDTPLARAAFYQFTSRDEDSLMVPFYDMSNHSNDPEKLNTVPEKPERPGEPFVLRAWRDIRPGEQIYISYNRCHRCWFDRSYKDCDSYSYYGTSDVFDIFGFVEDFPQSWKFKMNVGDGDSPRWDELNFCLTRDQTPGQLITATPLRTWMVPESLARAGLSRVRVAGGRISDRASSSSSCSSRLLLDILYSLKIVIN